MSEDFDISNFDSNDFKFENSSFKKNDNLYTEFKFPLDLRQHSQTILT